MMIVVVMIMIVVVMIVVLANKHDKRINYWTEWTLKSNILLSIPTLRRILLDGLSNQPFPILKSFFKKAFQPCFCFNSPPRVSIPWTHLLVPTASQYSLTAELSSSLVSWIEILALEASEEDTVAPINGGMEMRREIEGLLSDIHLSYEIISDLCYFQYY